MAFTYLLNPAPKKKAPKKKAKKKAVKKKAAKKNPVKKTKARKASPRRRGQPGTSKPRRKNPGGTKSMAKKAKKKRRKSTKRKKPAAKKRKKARKNPTKRRKPAAKKRTTKRRKPAAKRRKARKNPTKRRKSPRRRTTSRKFKPTLKNFLPNLKELQETGKDLVGLTAGWSLGAAGAKICSPGMDKIFASLNLTYGEDDDARHILWQAADIFFAFAGAGIVGTVLGKRARDKALLGGLFRVVSHVAKRYGGPKINSYFVHDSPQLADWVTSGDMPAAPPQLTAGPRALGDWVTAGGMRNMIGI